MRKKEIEERVSQLIRPYLESEKIDLVDVEFASEPKGRVLRIFIDKKGKVDLNTCAFVSEMIDPLIEGENIISGSYYLEVSSPGIERPLKRKEDYVRFIGSKISVKTFSPIDGRRKFTGILKKAGEEGFIIQCNSENYEIFYSDVSKANLVVEINF